MKSYALIVNSATSLSSAIGDIRALFAEHKFLKISVRFGKSRSFDQNSISHAWYEQIANELREDTPLKVKAFCKLHFGVPILRAEDEEFRIEYDARILHGFTYEQKLIIAEWLPVTSRFTRKQNSEYLIAVQAHYATRGVVLEFPDEN